ncbi:MAG: aminotransferase class V-fold PLP-dependent enzyme [Candidatus Marinimicrobia bacterium]|nr:aminotransferase class V-fold PLP-dependent enzyme [Candidatus Neomarinimicrobiota bacterium]
MKVFPRHQIDIRPSDLSAGLLSYCIPLNRVQLEKEILLLWEKEYVRVSFTVRTALDSIFTAASFPEGSEVLMSAINIKDMVKIAENHGLHVIAVDLHIGDLSITPESLEKLISPKTKVLIFAQLFGVIADLEPVYEVCRKYNILMIEDCAQAFCGSRYYGSQFADVSLFSFGAIKSSTALGGAIVAAKSERYIKETDSIEKSYPNRGEFWFFKRLLKYSVFKTLSTPRIYGLFIGMLTLFRYDIEKTINGFLKSFPNGELISQIRFQPPLRLLFLLRRRLKSNNDNNFFLREKAARSFLNNLDSSFTIPGKTAKYNSFWVLPILSDTPEKLQKLLLKHGFDSTQGKNLLMAIYKSRNARTIIEQILYLPDITRMTRKYRKRLVSVLCFEKNGYKS